MMGVRDWYRRAKALEWLSPGSFVLCAAAFSGTYLVLHLIGLRQYTSVFCGTVPLEAGKQTAYVFAAILYTLFHMLTMIVAPILIIAAGVFRLLNWLFPPLPRAPVSHEDEAGTGATPQ